MKKLLVFILVIPACLAFGQGREHCKKVLFLGNSFTFYPGTETGYNGLPQIVRDASASVNDTLIIDERVVSSKTLQFHASDSTSINKIKQGGLDFVVLQEQSTGCATDWATVKLKSLPYARKLDSLAHKYNSCSQTILYNTWGYNWVSSMTIDSMSNLIAANYMNMADSLNVFISPVGQIRTYLSKNYPMIKLFYTDNKHPSPEGVYAAAMVFYSVIFRKDPTLIIWNYTINPSYAKIIRDAAKLIAYNNLINWHVGKYDPLAKFTSSKTSGTGVTFTNLSKNSQSYQWNFGDGSTLTEASPSHIYSVKGIYNVELVASNCWTSSTYSMSVNLMDITAIKNIEEQDPLIIFPNPARNILKISNYTLPTDRLELLNSNNKIQIINMIGQTVLEKELDSISEQNKIISLDISSLTNGIYLLKIGVQIRRFTKQ